jgi:signal transduction histidine kinase
MPQAPLLESVGIAAPPAVEDTAAPATVVRHLAHELRQPLSTIETSAFYLQMILQNHPDRRVAAHLERIQNSVEQLDWILSDSIHYLCGCAARPQPIDLAEIISDTLAERSFAESVELDWRYPEVRPLVSVDFSQAQHLVRTALYVFRQVARSEQPVSLVLGDDGQYGSLDVSCDSPQWEGDCEALFEPFSPHLPSGSGLALASVRRIAQAHGGFAWASREAGALRLKVRLPKA